MPQLEQFPGLRWKLRNLGGLRKTNAQKVRPTVSSRATFAMASLAFNSATAVTDKDAVVSWDEIRGFWQGLFNRLDNFEPNSIVFFR